MSLEEGVNAYFVKTRSSETENEDFKTSSQILSSHLHENAIRHIKASEGYPLIASGQLTKRDVFIFDHFEGDFFKQLQQTKALIVGPRCLLVCLLKSEPIPYGKSPVYTTAMRDLKISASGITPQEKDELSIKIQWMGGYYLQNFGRCVTHLISNTIKSSKYEHATLNGKPVMHVDWVQRVWERSLVDYVSATDQEFDKYRLPIFFDANITSTGLATAKKDEVMRLVQDNGGTYHRAFRSQLVDIVITEKGKTDSEKCRAAQRLKKDILTTDWIFDSVKKGFALPIKDYQIKIMKASTPEKDDQSMADFTSTDHTQLSDISRIATPMRKTLNPDLTVNDTICSNFNGTQIRLSNNTFQAPQPPPSSSAGAQNLQRDVLLRKSETLGTQYRAVLEEISPREAKKAGSFLDGCCIYLSGFQTAEKEKLNRILNAGGATRYDAINDDITHIIVGQLNDVEMKIWKNEGLNSNVQIVRLDWLLESIKTKQTANENIYRVPLPNSREPDAPSPSSKKTLKSMNHSFKQPDLPTKKKLFQQDIEMESAEAAAAAAKTSNQIASMAVELSEMPLPNACSTELPMEEDEPDFLAQYSQENMAAPKLPPLPTPSTSKPPQSNAAEMSHLKGQNEKAGGTENNTEMPTCSFDYENLDFFQDFIVYVDRKHFPEELYSQMLRECRGAHGVVVSDQFPDPVDYALVTFEQSCDISKLPVAAKYIVTELYVEACMRSNELVPIEYYHKPIPHTADVQPLKGMTVVISVYADFEREFIITLAKLLGAKVNENYAKKEQPLLICPEPKGAKYTGALKWNFPVAKSQWLVDCAELGKKLPLRSYLVGESSEDFPSPSRTREITLNADVQMLEAKSTPTPTARAPAKRKSTTTTTTTDITPLRHKRVSELVTPIAAAFSNNNKNSVDSPQTPVNACGPTYSIDMMYKILEDIPDAEDREIIRGIIEDIRANPTPELERIKRQISTPMNRGGCAGAIGVGGSTTNSPGLEFCSTPAFKARMEEEFDKRWHIPTRKLKPETPIEVIRKRVIYQACRDAGIPVSSDEEDEQQNENKTPGSNVTPLQHNSANLNSKPLPRSLFMTAAAAAAATPKNQRRSTMGGGDGSFIPNTQGATNEKQTSISLDSPGGATAAVGRATTSIGKSTINFDKISFEETTVNSLRKSTASPDLKQITDYLRENKNKRQSGSASGIDVNIPAAAADAAPKILNPTTITTETEGHFIQPFESEQLLPNSEQMVDWRDPIEFNNEKRASKVRSMQYQGTPRFSISCADNDLRDEIIQKILQLGGEVCENLVNFDPECTHFVCERPNRGEKILGCISSGKWVLSLKYIEESFGMDNFIDEELYEWGNTKAINLPILSDDDRGIAQASYRWRKELTDLRKSNSSEEIGIFRSIRAILRIAPKTRASLSNVIKAGKGIVIEATTPYEECSDVQQATHCFVDPKKMPLNREDYISLKKNNVKIASFLYIQAYLMNGTDADFSNYEIKM